MIIVRKKKIRAPLSIICIMICICSCQDTKDLSTSDWRQGNFPKLQVGQDTLLFISQVRQFVAANLDVGNIRNADCDSFASISTPFEIEHYLQIFRNNIGTAKCGLTALCMVHVLKRSGIDSYTYNFGFENSRLSHVVVLVSFRGNLLVFDPYMNYDLLNEQGEHCSLTELFAMIKSKASYPRFKTDTTLAELIIDTSRITESQWRKLEKLGMNNLLENGNYISETYYLKNYNRCFRCGTVIGEDLFIQEFEERLQQETPFTEFHEAMALKINTLYGGLNSEHVNTRVDSLINEYFPAFHSES